MATIRADQRIARTPVTVEDLQRVVNAVNVRTGLILTRLSTMEANNGSRFVTVPTQWRARPGRAKVPAANRGRGAS
jgi:formylglycine-generating enzyme required for sulfatase activity